MEPLPKPDLPGTTAPDVVPTQPISEPTPSHPDIDPNPPDYWPGPDVPEPDYGTKDPTPTQP